MAIGPTLPPHLQKLADQQQQPDSDDEHSYGPAPPSSSRAPAPPSVPAPASIGPTLPPHLQANQQQADESDDEADNFGPALPPHLAARKAHPTAAGPQRPPAGPQRPTAGPSRPPAGYQAPSPPPRGRYDDESSDDDVVGPMPVPEGMQGAYAGSAIRDWEEREARWAAEREVSTHVYDWSQRLEGVLVVPNQQFDTPVQMASA